MSAYQTRKSATATEIYDAEGVEITTVWTAGDVYWEDAGAGTVHVGTPLEFHEWMVLHTEKAKYGPELTRTQYVRNKQADAWDLGVIHGHNAEGRLIDKRSVNPYQKARNNDQ